MRGREKYIALHATVADAGFETLKAMADGGWRMAKGEI